jgi:hypothetical protein
MLLSVEELYEALKTHWVIRVDIFFHNEINSKARLVDLFKYEGIESSVWALFHEFSEIDSCLKVDFTFD